jgi:hypothetical protein
MVQSSAADVTAGLLLTVAAGAEKPIRLAEPAELVTAAGHGSGDRTTN